MTDIVSPKKRSLIMSRVRDRDTKPELVVRSFLKKMGVSCKTNFGGLPGKPDIVLPLKKKVIFVHGCFWHQHKNCRAASRPSTRIRFWNDKLNVNIKRDRSNITRLRGMGYKTLVLWECGLKKSVNWEKKIQDFIYRKRTVKKK